MKNKLHNAWISPTGIVHTLSGFAMHDDWADDFLMGKFGRDWVLDNHKTSTDTLHDMGWVRILQWGITDKVQFIFDRRLTKSQKDAIFDFCIKNNIPTPDIF